MSIQTKDLKKAYDSPSWWYDLRGLFILTFAYHDTLWSEIRFFAKNYSDEHLEMAIGSGTLTLLCLLKRKLLGPRGKVAGIGLDYVPSMLAGAEWKFKFNSNWQLAVGDVYALPYEDNKFQTINVANAFHCFPDPKAAMGCLFRVLKPGGTLAVNVMHWPTQDGLLSRLSRWIMEWTIRKGILYSPYAPELIREAAARAGFEITHESPHGNSVYWLLKKPASQAGLINSA